MGVLSSSVSKTIEVHSFVYPPELPLLPPITESNFFIIIVMFLLLMVALISAIVIVFRM